MASLIVPFWLVLVVWLENSFLLEWRRILHQKRWGNCAHLLLLLLSPLSTLLMLATTGLIWWRFPPPSFVPWISVAALPAFSFGWTRLLKWLQSKTFRADTADSLFPHHKRTVFPLDAVVSIICHDGNAGNGFIIRYDGGSLLPTMSLRGKEGFGSLSPMGIWLKGKWSTENRNGIWHW